MLKCGSAAVPGLVVSIAYLPVRMYIGISAALPDADRGLCIRDGYSCRPEGA